MVMEDQIAQMALSMMIKGSQVIMRVSEHTARLCASATATTVKSLGSATLQAVSKGELPVSKLTKQSHGDVHFSEELSVEDIQTMKKTLHEYGVSYGIERNNDTGNYYLVFKGSDADLVKHALERTLQSMDVKVTPDDTAIPTKQETVDTSTTTKQEKPAAPIHDAASASKPAPEAKRKLSARDVRKTIREDAAKHIEAAHRHGPEPSVKITPSRAR